MEHKSLPLVTEGFLLYFSITMTKFLLPLSIILFLIIHSSSAQVYVGDSKRWIKIVLNAGEIKNNSTQAETDSSYTFNVRGKFNPEDLYFRFDRSNTCTYQKWTFECDTCFHIMLNSILNKSRYKWKTSGKGEYLSKASKQLVLKVDESKQLFTITQLYMREKDFQGMYEKATGLPVH